MSIGINLIGLFFVVLIYFVMFVCWLIGCLGRGECFGFVVCLV